MKIKNLLRVSVIGVVVIICAVAAGYLALNYMGFCYKERRFLSEEEMVSIAVKYILATYPPVVELHEGKGGAVINIGRGAPERSIAYKGISDFMAENQNCCEKTTIGREGYAISLEYRLLGSANAFVKVKYMVMYVDVSGVRQSSERTEYVAISNCGHPWSGI